MAALAGCATVPMASQQDDFKAKTFTASKDKSNIYLYRNETFGGAVLMTVTFDGKVAGQTGPQTYFLWEVPPGPHSITSVAENTATVDLLTEAGKSYFVWQEVKMGLFMARSQLQEVDSQTGRTGVNECKRAKSNF
jgi:hypothetical protein